MCHRKCSEENWRIFFYIFYIFHQTTKSQHNTSSSFTFCGPKLGFIQQTYFRPWTHQQIVYWGQGRALLPYRPLQDRKSGLELPSFWLMLANASLSLNCSFIRYNVVWKWKSEASKFKLLTCERIYGWTLTWEVLKSYIQLKSNSQWGDPKTEMKTCRLILMV